jgi:hypothetical protein
MNAIRIRRQLDSDTLHVPELKPFLGRTVEIIVLDEELPNGIRPGTGDWDAAARARQALVDYDYDALRTQDECDLQHADVHL